MNFSDGKKIANVCIPSSYTMYFCAISVQLFLK